MAVVTAGRVGQTVVGGCCVMGLPVVDRVGHVMGGRVGGCWVNGVPVVTGRVGHSVVGSGVGHVVDGVGQVTGGRVGGR